MAADALFAAVYDRLLGPVERRGLADRRRRLLSGVTGRVLEVGAGTGANLDHYGPGTELTLVEPSKPMRAKLDRRLRDAGREAEVVGARLERADLPAGGFDYAVSTLTLCSVRDLDEGLARILAALAPGGRLLFIEHVTLPGWRHRLHRAVDPAWTRLAGGCHLDRDIPAALRAAGFAVTDCERFRLPGANPLIGAAVQGRAMARLRPDPGSDPAETA